MQKTKRVSALVVALLMLVSLFSIGASAWETGEGMEVYWNGTYVSTVTYDAMDSAISQTSDATYAGINNYGTYKSYTGKVYTLSDLLTAVGKASDWNAASDTTTTLSLITPAQETATYTKAQLAETRYYYTSAGVQSTAVPVGFMKRTSGEDSYFKFVFGQTAATEKNVPRFWDLTGTGNSKVYIYTNATPTQCGAIYAQVNGTGTIYPSGSTIVVEPGDKIHFNRYNDSYLNSTMIYYTYGDINTTVPDPYCNDTSVNYIDQTPEYGGQFNPLECSSTAYWYRVKAIGLAYGSTNSAISSFTIRVEEDL